MFLLAENNDDIKDIAQIAKHIWKEHFIPIIGEQQVIYMLAKFLSEESIQHAISNDHYQFYKIMSNHKLIGFISIKEEVDTLFLSKLYVLKEERGHGYARMALNYIEMIAKQKGLSSIWLTCNKDNATTIAIYQKMGFTIFDSAVNDIGNGYVMDDYYLRKEV